MNSNMKTTYSKDESSVLVCAILLCLPSWLLCLPSWNDKGCGQKEILVILDKIFDFSTFMEYIHLTGILCDASVSSYWRYSSNNRIVVICGLLQRR